MRTGQIRDYLAYKEHPKMESAVDRAGDTCEFRYAGNRGIDGNRHQGGANRGI